MSEDTTMAYFDRTRQTILCTEVSSSECLTAALLQRSDRSWRPVYIISRSMTEAEKRYSQTEKDALAIKWAKERLKSCLVGAPKFRIVTSHKPLVPLFNKARAKMPPRIEKWVTEMVIIA